MRRSAWSGTAGHVTLVLMKIGNGGVPFFAFATFVL